MTQEKLCPAVQPGRWRKKFVGKLLEPEFLLVIFMMAGGNGVLRKQDCADWWW